MNQTKLHPKQLGALRSLSEGRASFFAWSRNGNRGKMAAWLVEQGLAVMTERDGGKTWHITDKGKYALAQS